MMTPTHLIVAAAAFARVDEPRRNALVFAGALLPDLSIYVLFAWARLVRGASERELWSVLYWQEPWQTLGAISNSFPLWGALLAGGFLLRAPLLAVFAGAGLLHLALDFPFHAGDAHRHFWPFSDWRFHSPVSYWDHRHHADIVAPIELTAAIALIILLWRRFRSWLTRAALGAAGVTYAAVPAYFTLMLGG